MTEAAAPTVDSIEHLDHDPMCEGPLHVGPPKPADYHCIRHTCPDILLCADCVEADFQDLAGSSYYRCDLCGLAAATLAELITVRPI